MRLAHRRAARAAPGLSPFYLVYGEHPRIPSDDSSPGGQPCADRLEGLKLLADAHSKAHELLLRRAIATNRVRDSKVTKTSFSPGTLVLIRNESGKKFESKWFGPYKVLEAHPLGTYALAEPSGRVLRSLINGSRLEKANVNDPASLWTSQAARTALRRAGVRLQRPEEVRKILESDENPPSYSDLSTFTREEWAEFERRNGARQNLVGEEEITEHIVEKARNRARVLNRAGRQQKNQKRSPSKIVDDSESDSTSSESEDSSEEDASQDQESQATRAGRRFICTAVSRDG